MISPAQWVVFRSGALTVIGQAWVKKLPIVYPEITTQIPSNTTQEVHAWTGKLPKMRLWTGQRVVFEVAPQTYTLVNQPFESTLGIDQFDLEDDKFGVYWRMLQDMAEQARWQPDYMLRDLLENSGDQTMNQDGLDGFTGFYTAHPVDLYNASAGTYSNDFRGGGQSINFPAPGGGSVNITIGGAAAPTALFTLVGYQQQLKGEDGEALGIIPDTVMFHTIMRGEWELMLRSSFFAPAAWGTISSQVGTADNPLQRYGLRPLMNSLLTQPYTWYSMDTSRGFRPFIHQVHTATQMVPRVNPNDPVVFSDHKFLFGQWDRQAVGWGPAFLVAVSGA